VQQAWSFLSVSSDNRQFSGNDGYEDDLGSFYSWDSTVANHARPQVGDLVVIRDGVSFHGWALIERIDHELGSKKRRRCPECGSTGFKERSTREPRYRCSCSAEFDEPSEEDIQGLTRYRAWYRSTYRALEQPIPVSKQEHIYRSRAAQHSIRSIDAEEWLRLVVVGGHADGAARARDLWTAIQGGYVLRVSPVRIGQQQFRKQLRDRFGWTCALTGPAHPVSLEAAHLYRYSEKPVHLEGGGLLFRRDLHALFDRFLISIEPDSWSTQIAPSLMSYASLAALEGVALQVPQHLYPDPSYLEAHHEKSTRFWRLAM
jgi:hypothetical protein